MTDRAVTFRNVTVTRTLGIDHGQGFELPDLSAGVNLIYGPNGSGKTTTARVLQALLWPGRTDLPRPTARGELTAGDATWRVDLDAGHVSASCNDQAGQVPDFGPPENARRYRLALHELIVDDDRSFAEQIVTASQGGYDLSQAAENIKQAFERPGPAPRTLRSNLKKADDAVRKASRKQEELAARERELDDLRAQRSAAQQASRQAELLEKVLSCRQANRRCDDIESRIAQLPDPVTKLRGDEREKLDEIDQRIGHCQDTLRDLREKIENSREIERQANLPEGLSDEAKVSLAAAKNRLGRLQPDLDRVTTEAEQAGSEAARARKRLGDTITDEQLDALEAVEIPDAGEFARRAHRIAAETEAQKEMRHWLDRPVPDDLVDLDAGKLGQASLALARWLQCGGAGRPAALPWPALAAAGWAALLAITLAVIVSPWWVLAVVPAAALAGAAVLRRHAKSPESGDRDTYRRDFGRTGIAGPASWEVGAVSRRLEELQDLSARLAEHQQRTRRLEQLAAEEKKLAERVEAHQQRRRELEKSLGFALPVSDEWLPALAENLGAWHRQSALAESKKASRDRLRAERDELLTQIGDIGQPLGCERPESSGQACEIVDALLQRAQRWEDARKDIDSARRRIDSEIEPELQRLADQRRAIFERLGVDESAEGQLDAWLEQLPGLDELKTRLTREQGVRDEARSALAGRDDLLELDDAEVQQRIDRQQELADRRDGLSEQIAGIETEIAAAKAGHDLTDALARRDEIAADLDEARDARCAQAVGQELTRWVRQEAVERARPEVFRRAQGLLAEITRGNLSLEIDDSAEPPAFRAGSFGDPPRPIEQLSVGERVQLLMAVRLAFVEQDESLALPLILDEALGTTDDTRAEAIIDSLVTVAGAGRQVFYFTAQHDEVGKWLARLRQAGVDHREYDLAKLRGLASAGSRPLDFEAYQPAGVPAPDGATREQYARTLGVAGIDPRRAWDAHLWHAVEDSELLHRMLEMGIDTCGQLRTLIRSGSASGLDEGSRAAALRAEIIERACELWQQGRGRPVDRAALEDSGAVSENFIDEVSELARELGGSGEALLRALKEGRVSGFRSAKIDDLRAYFREQGYVDDQPVLEARKIIARLVAELGGAMESSGVSGGWFRSMVESLRASAPAGDA